MLRGWLELFNHALKWSTTSRNKEMKKILIEKQIYSMCHDVPWFNMMQCWCWFSLHVSLCSFPLCSYNYKFQWYIMRVSNHRFWSNKSPALEYSTHSQHPLVTKKWQCLKKEKRRKATKRSLNATLKRNALVKGMSYTLESNRPTH